MASPENISIVIPTYGRKEVLLQTIQSLIDLRNRAKSIIVVDQNSSHDKSTESALKQWMESGLILWLRHNPPSIPSAMNKGLLAAESEFVLFLDDDIIPCSDLVAQHAAALNEMGESNVSCIAGQVLQPGETVVGSGNSTGGGFKFNSGTRMFIGDVMAGNLCVHRDRAIDIGGFDENFIGVAYRFESEFARRVILNGGKILFEPGASIRHLRAACGGTRKYGNHLTSASPAHGVGDYYFTLRQGLSLKNFFYILKRPCREVRTEFHLKHPWWIPIKLAGEIRAFVQAIQLYLKGPKYITHSKNSNQ